MNNGIYAVQCCKCGKYLGTAINTYPDKIKENKIYCEKHYNELTDEEKHQFA